MRVFRTCVKLSLLLRSLHFRSPFRPSARFAAVDEFGRDAENKRPRNSLAMDVGSRVFAQNVIVLKMQTENYVGEQLDCSVYSVLCIFDDLCNNNNK